MDATEAFEKFRPELAAKKPNVSLGEFLTEIRATADVSHHQRLRLERLEKSWPT
jgi:hypothetical protein